MAIFCTVTAKNRRFVCRIFQKPHKFHLPLFVLIHSFSAVIRLYEYFSKTALFTHNTGKNWNEYLKVKPVTRCVTWHDVVLVCSASHVHSTRRSRNACWWTSTSTWGLDRVLTPWRSMVLFSARSAIVIVRVSFTIFCYIGSRLISLLQSRSPWRSTLMRMSYCYKWPVWHLQHVTGVSVLHFSD